jgi:hypothetical protein
MKGATGSRAALVTLAVIAAGAALPAACFYPTYTFDLAEPTGAGGGGSTTSGAGGAGGVGGSTVTSTTSAGGAGGSTTATTGSGAQGGGGSGGSGGGSCLGGADNNACADPACMANYECVPLPPTGWANYGIAALYASSPMDEPVGCTGDDPTDDYDGNSGLSFDPDVCSACSCGAPSGMTCSPTGLGLAPDQAIQIADATCVLPQASSLSLVTVQDACTGVCFQGGAAIPGGDMCGNPASPCNQSARVTLPTISGGTCGAGGGTASATPVTWNTAVRACNRKGMSLGGGGCPAGQVCEPKPPAPFLPHVCVGQAGMMACPGTPYTEQYIAFTGYNDQRGCDACSCGPVEGGTCDIAFDLYSDGACSDLVGSVKASATCADLAGNPPIGSTTCTATAVSGASCTPKPSTPLPNGTVTPDDTTAVTFCCIQ